MDKINFESGTKIKSATVTIDNVEHEVQPAQYSGNTPLNPTTLNLLQTNIENEFAKSNTKKIYDQTNSEYNIRVRAYRSGNVVTLTIYTTSVSKAINQGQQNINIGNIGTENAPIENFIKKVFTSAGKKFNLECRNQGDIAIGYTHDSIETQSQIAEVISFVCK